MTQSEHVLPQPFQSTGGNCYHGCLASGATTMRRRDLIKAAGLAAAWPLMARAQQSAMPVVGFLSGRSLASDSDLVAAFSRALNEAG
jgi:hypothetical protein